ncbi:MAG: putative serine/threonine-protein kinase Nek1, partial [Streblomastix strix]
MAWKEMKYDKYKKETVDNEVRIIRDACSYILNQSPSFLPIVEPLGFFAEEQEAKAYLVMEYCEGGDLQKYIQDMKKSGSLISKALSFIEQLLSSVNQIHENNIIHGDLKPQNILLSKDKKIKLADFGLAQKLQAGNQYKTSHLAGTMNFIAPELFQIADEPQIIIYKISADIWACGIILYELLSQQHPFLLNQIDIPDEELKRRVINDEPPELPSQYPESMTNLIKSMLIK